MSRNSVSRVSGIDTARLVANFLVTVSHWFSWYGPSGGAVYLFLYYVLGKAAYIPVPFFFLVSGYFIRQSIEKGKTPGQIFHRYWTRILSLFVFWSVVYSIVPYVGPGALFNQQFSSLAERWRYVFLRFWEHPVGSLMTGLTDHLWFLPSLIIGCAWLAWVTRWQKTQWLFTISCLSYAFNLVTGGQYSPLFGSPELSWAVSRGVCIPVTFMSLGYLIRQRKVLLSYTNIAVLLGIGVVVSFVERYTWIHIFYDLMRYPFNIGTIPLALSAFFFALNSPSWFQLKFLKPLAPLTLGVYAAHLLVDRKIHQLNWFSHGSPIEFLGPVAVYLLTLGLVFVCSKARPIRRFFSYD